MEDVSVKSLDSEEAYHGNLIVLWAKTWISFKGRVIPLLPWCGRPSFDMYPFTSALQVRHIQMPFPIMNHNMLLWFAQ